jgi:predicted nucleotidyltransferase
MLSNRDKQALKDINEILKTINIPMIIVGAGARLLIFDRKYNVQGRSTTDLDIAIKVENWQNYQTLCERLTQEDARFQKTSIPHRLVHCETQIGVDIVPFGKISEPNFQIKWSNGNIMNVAGFNEALLSAKLETIDDLELQVVNIPAFITLKLLAWGDRGERTNKDLDDINLVLKYYQDQERVYEELVDEVANGNLEFLDASIYLLGRDICKIFQSDTIDQLKTLLVKLEPSLEENSDSLEYRLQILEWGIDGVIPK